MPTPIEIHGHHGGPDGAWFPFLGLSVFLLLLVLAVATLAYLWRTGRLSGISQLVRPSPDQTAKQVLAERFARGDLSPEEFMERASILNWTPGSDSYPARGRRRVPR